MNPGKLIWLFLLLAIASLSCLGQSTFSIEGTVTDQLTRSPLAGVNISVEGSPYGTSTDEEGAFSLELPPGNYTIHASYVGYQNKKEKLQLTRNRQIQLELAPLNEMLQEVKVAEKQRQQKPSPSGSVSLSAREIKDIPPLLGEADVLKVIQLLPGVQGGTEGTTGFHVRGGSPDQNLILLDGVPMYNASHLFGFFSVFNADIIKDINLTKGGFPARYGGRLSSVLDIELRKGNPEEYHGAGTLGLLSPKLMLEGPIVEGKSSFLVSGRRSIYDLVVVPFVDQDNRINYHFGDLNLKLKHIFSDKDEVFLSYFTSGDRFHYQYDDLPRYAEESGIKWGNHTVSAGWQHGFGEKLSSRLLASFNNYRFNTYSEQNDSGEVHSLDYLSRIRDVGLRYDFDYQPGSRHSVKFGAGYTYHSFRPGALQMNHEYQQNEVALQQNLSEAIYSHDIRAYAEDTWQVWERLHLNAGLHYGVYQVQNSTYHSLQPRLAAQYFLTDEWQLTSSYSEMTQFLHLLSNTGMGLPTDLWVSATDRVKPQQARQWTLGSTRMFYEGSWELSADLYYKSMQHLIEYKEGASYLSLTDWQNVVETDGRGEAYGLEVLLRKNEGNTTGWIAYTLARSTRQFENLNNGKSFPYRYDRRHDLSIVLHHKFNEKIDVSATWVYQSGIAFTAPTARYLSSAYWGFPQSENLSDRNAYRYPAYHRLDLGVNFKKQKNWGTQVINISIYNAYNQVNPFFIDLREKEQKATVIGLFPIIPSISYSFKF